MQSVEVDVIENKSGLLMAIGEKNTMTHGLMVAGRTMEEVRQQIPAALVELLAAMGIVPENKLEVVDHHANLPSGWTSRRLIVREIP